MPARTGRRTWLREGDPTRLGDPRQARMGSSPARVCALAVVRRVFEDGAYADRALHGEARAARALAARPGARDAPRLRRRAAARHARPRDRGARRPARPQARARRARRRCGWACSSSRSWTACPRTPPCRVGRARQARLARAAPASSTPCCGGPRARRARWSTRCPTARPPRPRCATRTRAGSPSCGSRRSAPETARALMAAGNEPAEAAVRANALRTTPAELAAQPAGRLAPGRPAARGPRARRAVRRVLLAAVGGGPVHAPVARRDGRRAASSTPSPASPSSTSAPRPGAKTTHLAALMGGEGRSWPSSGTRAAPRRSAARPRGWARRSVEVRVADAAAPQEAGAYDRVLVDPPCSDLGHARRAPGRALAQGPGGGRRAGRAARRRSSPPPRRRSGRAASSSTRPARSPRPRTSSRIEAFLGQHRGLRARGSAVRPPGLGPSGRATRQADAPAPGRHGRILHREDAAGMSDDHVDLGDVCPACGEPWLRPDQPPRPLPLRELPAPVRAALGVPELRRALDDRADVATPRCTRATTAGASMLQPI